MYRLILTDCNLAFKPTSRRNCCILVYSAFCSKLIISVKFEILDSLCLSLIHLSIKTGRQQRREKRRVSFLEKVCLRTCLDPWASTTNRKMTCIPTHLVGWVKLMSSSYSWLEPKVPNMFGAKFCPFFWRGWGGGCLGKD